MINIIKGEVILQCENSLTIMVGGIGIEVFATHTTLQNVSVGESIILHTELILRENNISIYGFEIETEKSIFKDLLKVNGVGPKASLSIISSLPTNEIIRAIRAEDAIPFTKAQGVGKKTAQRIILSLKDKMDGFPEINGKSSNQSEYIELLDTLVGLGYSIAEAQACIQSLPADVENDMSTKIRLCLQYFSPD